MKAYSIDFRQRVLAACEQGEPTSQVAHRFGVSPAWVRRLKQRLREDGTLRPRASGGDRRSKFDPAALEKLAEQVAVQPDATLEQLRGWADRELGITCSLMAVCRALKRIGMTLKKTMRAAEQDRPDVAQGRQVFERTLGQIRAEQLVFLDESGAKTNMTRLYGRAPCGQRCHFATPNGHWQTTTMISALRCSGVIPEASLVVEGPMNALIFRGYVERMLAPVLRPGDVVVMDNLASHKVAGVAEAIEGVGARLLYLPPYSPDLNPIEKMWSKVKTMLRRIAARDLNQLIQAIGQALMAVQPDECLHYFQSCGYATSDR